MSSDGVYFLFFFFHVAIHVVHLFRRSRRKLIIWYGALATVCAYVSTLDSLDDVDSGEIHRCLGVKGKMIYYVTDAAAPAPATPTPSSVLRLPRFCFCVIFEIEKLALLFGPSAPTHSAFLSAFFVFVSLLRLAQKSGQSSKNDRGTRSR